MIVRVNGFQRIKGNGIFNVSRIEIDHIFDSLFGDIVQEMFSAKSPCGSIKAKPFPALISEITMFSIRVDLPVPVLPMIYIWPPRSFSLMPNSLLVLR